MKKTTLTLSLAKGSQEPRRISLEGPVVKLGSDPKNHVALDDHGARAMHAVIEIGEGTATIIDLGSDVGTSVNDARVNRCKLQVGDEIRIGSTMLRIDAVS